MTDVKTIIAALRYCHEFGDCEGCPLWDGVNMEASNQQVADIQQTCDDLALLAANLLERASDIIGKTDYACDGRTE